MGIKVLVVDDSMFFQKRISEILKPVASVEIIGFANNGKEAIEKAQSLKPDVITMDYEMPVMDGLTALRKIMEVAPTPVLMFSSLTYDGARVTLDALDAGAVDFLPKNFEDLQKGGPKIRETLSDKIQSVAKQFNRSPKARFTPIQTELDSDKRKGESQPARPARQLESKLDKPLASQPKASATSRFEKNTKQDTRLPTLDLIVIATSTGGPVALQKVLSQIPASFSKPIVLIQHMPATFTQAFAERLNKTCALEIKLAEDGDILKPGRALLAPGGKQLLIEKSKVRVIDGDDRVNYRPCADLTMASAAKHYPGKSLGIVLTGMGSDGCEGAKLMQQTGSPIWAQDEETSVIYGMPMAVAKAHITSAILPLQDIGPTLVKEVR
ncbi:chemotaxis response regulator protein-glutamate methylesterase [Bermanella marisrubri]|uniref:Protein-glutamate methylesterase/protein-glutamine glutaminase n=1 Tax=Bermanella marisrubri TaxID=207949 RepID=Q1N2U1_9GAMM|nr:chemotaxis response regulator protein-glutamate methylesterase [Bermanella marisrubri]EAT12578.1 chemotaxis-specific methylesterase [Oceanobacter sp. RED65] [Bermanella marisrubri]QIZ84866.1 chemotaxis response regulator protein-glutamate methylesterase [Bermanella marisrubri]